MLTLAALVTIALTILAVAGLARLLLADDSMFGSILGMYWFCDLAGSVLSIAGQVLAGIAEAAAE